MSDVVTSSVDGLFDEIDDDTIDDELDSKSKHAPYIDSRRRLESRIAERHLARDLQEFDFDL